MAHPSKNLPKNLYYINSTDELTAPEGRHFFSITSLDGGTVNVKGGGIYEFVDVSELADNDAAAEYIDPLTGKPFASKDVAEDSDHGDDYYEAVDTTSVGIVLAAGQTVFGRFTSVTSAAASKEFLVYA